MSKFWSMLPKMSNENEEGIISFSKPFEFQYDNIEINENMKVKILMNQQHQNSIVYFILENGISPSGNSYLVDPKFLNQHLTTTMYENSTNKILGFAMGIFNTIRLSNTDFKSIYTTLLTVNVENRKSNLARYIISSIIDHNYNIGNYVGYHFISNPRTVSNIHCHTYFRPLNIKVALNYGYEVPVGDYELNSNSDYSVQKTVFKDLELCSKTERHLNLNLTETEFNNLTQHCEALTVIYKRKVVGIIIFRSTLLHIFRVKRLCPIARILYTEMIPKHRHHVMTSIINYLVSLDKYVVMSGVCLSELSDEKFRRSMGFITAGNIYLDFYNFNISKEFRTSKDINVLYV